jgi:hypothetical protein
LRVTVWRVGFGFLFNSDSSSSRFFHFNSRKFFPARRLACSGTAAVKIKQRFFVCARRSPCFAKFFPGASRFCPIVVQVCIAFDLGKKIRFAAGNNFRVAAFLLFSSGEKFVMNAGRKAVLKKWLGLAGAVLFMAGFNPAAHAVQSFSLAWNKSSDKKVTGYFLYYGTASGQYTSKINFSKNTRATVSNLQEGKTYYFAVTSYNAQGVESVPSKEITFIVPGALVLEPRSGSGGPACVKFPVAPKHWYEVQATQDLHNWVTIAKTTKATSNAWVEYADAAASACQQRFYRLVLH